MFSASPKAKNIILKWKLKFSVNFLAQGAKALRKTEYHETRDEIMRAGYSLEAVIK